MSEAILRVASALPLGWPLDKAIRLLRERASADSLEKVRLMLDTCQEQVRRLEQDFAKMRANSEASKAREELASDLLLDASRKAAVTRAKGRVKRIGLILANAISDSDVADADEIEEMMRVAMELSDGDIKYLKELIRIEGALLANRDHIPRYDGYMLWEQGSWGGHVNPELDSAFSKLESYGLVVRIAPPNNQNLLADFQNRYLLLKKGARFAKLAREAAGR
jgi:hypothetical protein